MTLYALPKEIHALIASYLPERSGNLMRMLAHNVIVITAYNDCTYANGLLHSFNDEPITATSNNLEIMHNYILVDIGDRIWFSHGMISRTGDLPAVILDDHISYYVNDKLHRDNDLPAIITSIYSVWYQHGKRHRDNNPAYISIHGLSIWYQHGVKHRDNDLPAYVDEAINRSEWYQYGELHRDNDLPAAVHANKIEYYINDRLHRDNGPAFINNGYSAYYKHGNRHRIDGPAVIYSSGAVEYYIDGVLCNKPINTQPNYLFSAAVGIVLGIAFGTMIKRYLK
jgi:transposase InsO family protein